VREASWDPVKAAVNWRKHRVSFEEARTVIDDRLAWVDVDRSDPTDTRAKTIGWSRQGRLLVVITSVRGDTPRLISARRATKRERHDHEHRRR